MLNRLVNYHALALFYADREGFTAFVNDHPHGGGEGARPVQLDEQEYSDLLWATDADLYVPLWASACKNAGDVLMNAITLNVIRTYKKYGYSPEHIDGNPPDYAGEQLRFLEYLAACAVNGSLAEAEAETIITQFTRDYLVDTLRPTVKAIEESGLDTLRPAAELIRAVIRGEFHDFGLSREEVQVLPYGFACKDPDPASGTAAEYYYQALTGIKPLEKTGGESAFDAAPTASLFATVGEITRQEELPVEEPHKVSIASFSDCGSKCKMLATVAEGCVLSIEPDTDGTPLRFTGCPRGLSYPHTFLTSRRPRYPMVRRTGRGQGKFRRISWAEAERINADAIRETKEKYGPGGRFVIASSGNNGAMRGNHLVYSLLNEDGGSLGFYNFYSAGAEVYILPYIYGQIPCCNHVSSYADSKLILLWGINPSSGHFGFGLKEVLAQAKENGAEIIVIDPRMSDTMLSVGDQWIAVKPSSDAALADAMAYVIFEKGLQDQGFMDRFCLGFDEEHMPEGVPYGESYKSYLFGVKDGVKKTPAWAEPITGVPADVIEELAVKYATKKPAALLGGFGMQRTMIGEQVIRCQTALACMTGSLGVWGGSPGTYPSWEYGKGVPFYPMTENPYPGAIPLFQWTRAIDRPETVNARRGLVGLEKMDCGIKLIYSLGSGVMLNQHSNINDTMRILRDESKLEHLIISDVFMTPSSRFADIFLPAPSFMEVDNIMGSWSSDRYFLFNNACLKPLFGSRFEYYWLREVADLLGLKERYDQGNESMEDWFRTMYQTLREADPETPPYEEYRKNSAVVYDCDLKKPALKAQLQDGKPFNTPSGKIEIFSKTLYDMGRPDDIPGIPRYIGMIDGPEDTRLAEGKLQLISYHTKKRVHSQHDHNALLAELDPNCLWIHPRDAVARGIKDGDQVEIFNEYGTVRLPAKVTERVMPGVICFSEGGWYKPDAAGVDTGGSINVLTSTEVATPLANSNPQQTNIADVRKI
ncbi:MAG: molybdopterin-dependent oxidoreductase [Firmicutes bacterium]|nr:molybdopterin-dependent oxidoreductase [Bacillota bacterium]